MSTSFKGFQIIVRVLLRAHLLDSIIRTSTVFTYMRCGTRLLRKKTLALPIISMWPWANSLTFQYLHFLTWLVTNSHRVIVRIKRVCCCCPVAKLSPTLYNPMDCTSPVSSVLHCLLEFAQIHVHWVSDARTWQTLGIIPKESIQSVLLTLSFSLKARICRKNRIKY